MRQLTEGQERFWKLVFEAITAMGLVFGGLFAVLEYLNTRETALTTAAIQASTAKFEAKRPFYTRQLELCELASSQAAILATPAKRTSADLARARDEFWRLYWGPLGIVEDQLVEAGMVKVGDCLEGKPTCEATLSQASLNLAHACRELVSKSWELGLPPIGDKVR